jgi:hypothetical protein
MKTLTTLVVWTLAATASAADLDGGLVTAVDRIGGNLLGPAAFDAVLFDPQPDPPRLRLFLSEAQSQPMELLIGGPGDSGEENPPEPVRVFFRMTVGGGESIRLEYDPKPGEIIPCIEPPADLSGIALAPADNLKTGANLRAGLANALGEVGKNLLGPGRIDAVLFDPQPDPPRLRLFLSREQAHLVEVVVTKGIGGPGDVDPLRPFFRMVVGGEEVTLEHDREAGGRAMPAIEESDLSGISAPR